MIRVFFCLGVVVFAPFASAQEPQWSTIFDGKSLDGWKAADHDECFKLKDGAIVAGGGPMAHLFYVGPIAHHDFKNFELKLEVQTKPGSNGGIFFHTEPQSGFLKKGYEAQVCNTHTDKRRTGSLLIYQGHPRYLSGQGRRVVRVPHPRLRQADRIEGQRSDDRRLHGAREPAAAARARAAHPLARPDCSAGSRPQQHGPLSQYPRQGPARLSLRTTNVLFLCAPRRFTPAGDHESHESHE